MLDVTPLADLARRRDLRVAVAESLTSGALASAIGAGPEASTWFGGGIVAYLPEVKERVLGFPADQDPTSAGCAEQLARGARELFDADLCVSTTGVGGPDAEDGHPAGTVFLGWATRDEAGHRRLDLDGEPEDVLEATVEAAVELLFSRAGRVERAGRA
ncbi:CinA family protein [Microbacterium sp. Re1]|uniref:CinA family protein n=1 Tax=Microbacterium commune TaxID=2762219 RepID=A0ABR8W3I3_9MICO|nr:nicotinamide-nucleotide amidohydrolase family protein [Microbacterium commune]MBD8011577.1 CinA family protein [Microbacterium commune]